MWKQRHKVSESTILLVGYLLLKSFFDLLLTLL